MPHIQPIIWFMINQKGVLEKGPFCKLHGAFSWIKWEFKYELNQTAQENLVPSDGTKFEKLNEWKHHPTA